MVVSFTVYGLVSLAIAGPGIAIIITNIQYSKAFLTATVLSNSGFVVAAPQLEVTLTETVKLLYTPKNYLVSVGLGCALCALSLCWGVSRGLRAARQPVKEDKEPLSLEESSSQELRAFKSLPSDAQMRQMSPAEAGKWFSAPRKGVLDT